MQKGSPDESIGLVLLAAGESRRMGRPKQLLPYRGTTLLRQACQTATAAAFAPVVVVLGYEKDACRGTFGKLPVDCVTNPAWPLGMGTSIAAGVARMIELRPNSAAVALLLVDQPLITPDDLIALRAAWRSSCCTIAGADYDGRCGVPAIFSRTLFPELLALDGNEGARSIIAQYSENTVRVPMPNALFDVDTPEAYDAIVRATSMGEADATSPPPSA